jgi:hypothetical protein
VLSRHHNTADLRSSINKGIVAPAIALARKVGVRFRPYLIFPTSSLGLLTTTDSISVKHLGV